MKYPIKRILITCVIAASASVPALSQTSVTAGGFARALPIPPILENTSTRSGEVVLNLVAQKGRTELLAGKPTDSLGFNGDYLGPTIRVSRGDRVRMSVENTLSEDTTVHWHGLHVPGEMDGGPRQVIQAGTTWKPEFTINQEAATLWYHPHLMGKTAEHVYLGMAGLFIIDDERSDGLALPRTYGVDDIPIVLQDRRLSADGRLTYRPRMPDIMHGLQGNVMLVNGAHRPFVEVPAGLVRLRVLNGSNSTVYRVSLDDQSAFQQIASDGGFLERPLEQTRVTLAPGERAEILVDFGAYKAGQTVNLVSEMFQGEVFQALQFRVGGNPVRTFSVPTRLNEITRFKESEADKTRRFVLSTMGRGGQLTINGKHMDMDRIDERVTLGDMEIWELSNQGMGMGMMEQIPHSMHLHDVQFQVLSIDGEPPPANLMGWKDTVLIWPGETVRIAARFEDYTGIYMYHCHFLEHEDAGMMGQFEVTR